MNYSVTILFPKSVVKEIDRRRKSSQRTRAAEIRFIVDEKLAENKKVNDAV